jgi:hypothetical protein
LLDCFRLSLLALRSQRQCRSLERVFINRGNPHILSRLLLVLLFFLLLLHHELLDFIWVVQMTEFDNRRSNRGTLWFSWNGWSLSPWKRRLSRVSKGAISTSAVSLQPINACSCLGLLRRNSNRAWLFSVNKAASFTPCAASRVVFANLSFSHLYLLLTNI